MIIIRLVGGLGNQLFQYALGRKLSILQNTQLKIDISPFLEYKLHKYSLSAFNIIEDVAKESEIDEIKNSRSNFFLRHKIFPSFVLKHAKNIYFIEEDFGFNNNILKINYNSYLEGYFQTEKYFLDIRKTLISDLSLKIPMSPLTRNVFDEIGKTNSISIHIRRADYLDKNTNEKHGCCSMDYYRQAINYMSKMVEKPTFFIFSDDIEFSKHALKSPFQVRFVDHNGPEKNYEDLILMSNCSHNIIANSTFSWWAAWLNRNPDKIVIAPSRWFTDSRLNSNNIIPDKWLKL